MRFAILSLGFVLSLNGWAQKVIAPADPLPPRRTIAAETEISVDDYMKDADAFEVLITHESAVGPNIATPEDLKKALGREGSREQFIKDMLRDKSAVYVLKRKLPLLWESEVLARKAKHKSH